MAKSAKFKPGDLVELKSGGPVMTVEEENKFQDDKWDCIWFAGEKHQSNTFAGMSLKLAEGID